MPDLEAPDALVAEVLEAVRRRETRPPARTRRLACRVGRTAALGFALVMVVWLLIFNPAHFAGQLLGGTLAWKMGEVFAMAFRLWWSEVEVCRLPLVLALSGLGSASYCLCLAAAKVLHRLSREAS